MKRFSAATRISIGVTCLTLSILLAAQGLGGNSWENIGPIWYETMIQLTSTSDFKACARISVQVATTHGAAAKKAVQAAWKKVGITV